MYDPLNMQMSELVIINLVIELTLYVLFNQMARVHISALVNFGRQLSKQCTSGINSVDGSDDSCLLRRTCSMLQKMQYQLASYDKRLLMCNCNHTTYTYSHAKQTPTKNHNCIWFIDNNFLCQSNHCVRINKHFSLTCLWSWSSVFISSNCFFNF